MDALLATSQLARVSATNYPAIARADVCDATTRLLAHDDAGVRARSCNLLGNMCRHSGYFYDAFKTRGVLAALVDRCADPDRTTRKFACFAIGNAGFHGDALYGQLRAAIAPLTRLLADEEDKTRANAAAALGNLVRNSAALCGDLVRAGALEALVELATGAATDGSGARAGTGGGADAQSPVKIALFSLGNLCTHEEVERDSSRSGSKRAWTRWRIRGIRPCAGTSRAYRVRSPPRGTAAGGERRRRRSGGRAAARSTVKTCVLR